VPQESDFCFVVLFHLYLSLLKLVDLRSDHFHFLKLSRQLMLKLASTSGLVLEFLAQLLQQLRQTGVWSRHHPTMSVVHGERLDEESQLSFNLWQAMRFQLRPATGN
jgi:hypothetical protein